MDRAVLETASDRYVIVEYLAEGGMGAIYLGKKLGVDGFEKEVVLKQLLPEYTREQKFIDMFLREARLSAALDHANIVRTVDLVAAGDDYFMVMEYVRGGDLRTLLKRARRRRKRFAPQAAVFIAHEILEALAYAHNKSTPDGRRLNLIHRDVSPSNILLSGAGEVKLTDFGIAKAGTNRSVFFKVKGKVGYMSPEQARGETVDARTDVFSLGVVLYEVLVGERLFVGDLLSSASMIYSQRVTPPSKKRPDVPAEIDEVILKALQLDPRNRFQSAEDFQEALGRAASRNRLLFSASDMAAHLRAVCGEDPSTWLKLEQLGFDESQAIRAGTAVLTGHGTQIGDDFDDSEPHQTRNPKPASAFKKELTSVIALRGEDIQIIDSLPLPLQPLEPRRSEPIATRTATPTPTPTAPFPQHKRQAPTFDGEDSQARATIVRDSGSPRSSRPSTWDEATREGRSQPARVPAPQPQPPQSSGGPTQPMPTISAGSSGVFETTDSVRRVPPDLAGRKRRLLPVIMVLLLIGIGVAVGVAFSGPELEVVDPQLQAPVKPPR